MTKRSRRERHKANQQQKNASRQPKTPVDQPPDDELAHVDASIEPSPVVETALGNDQPLDDPGQVLLIEPRDPMLVRDARPFSSDPGARAFTLPWPFPRTIAKTMRARIGESTFGGGFWHGDDAGNQRAHMARMEIRGPLMVAKRDIGDDWQVYVPAPQDVVFHRNPKPNSDQKPLHAMVKRPVKPSDDEGVSAIPIPTSVAGQSGFTNASRRAVMNPVLSVTDEVKPESDVPTWWSLADARRWLEYVGNDPKSRLPIKEYADPNDSEKPKTEHVDGLRSPLRDSRTHVRIQCGTQTNVEGALFTTESLAFPSGHIQESLAANTRTAPPAHLALAVRIKEAPDGWQPETGYVPLGGERRLSLLSDAGDATSLVWPETPPPPAGWESAKGLRLLLVTPAIFTYGWLPEWLGNGTIPGLNGSKLQLHLVGAAIERRIPVSGWNSVDREVLKRTVANGEATYEKTCIEMGPNATEYAVPAGGVYFFRVTRGALTRDIWEKLWLAPISDLRVNRNQGFGLVLPGIWDASEFADLDLPPTTQEESHS